MKRLLFIVIVVVCMVSTGMHLYACLLDYGTDGELFYDSQTSLYWFDPGVFAGWTPGRIDGFVREHSLWNWGCLEQVSSLAQAASAHGCPLTSVLGAEAYTGGSSCCWVGFIHPEDTFACAGICSDLNSSAIQLYTPLESGAGNSGDIVISGTTLYGAWLYSQSDPLEYTAPVPEPSTIFMIGAGLIGFAGVMRKFKGK